MQLLTSRKEIFRLSLGGRSAGTSQFSSISMRRRRGRKASTMPMATR